MTMIATLHYQAKPFDLRGLKGMSDRTIELHLSLYHGYVREANRLSERIRAFLADGPVDQDDMPLFSELTRRLGFEYNGMVLHEYYFGNLIRQGTGDPDRSSSFIRAAEASFGSYGVWKTDFVATASMRGVGWAICYYDPMTGRLSNHWISSHEVGTVAGFVPLLVLDLWEHAFLLDYAPSERQTYVETFFANVHWEAVDERLSECARTRMERVRKELYGS
ncbi:MAG TPA: Fe-Mn family superoxide dismutase [Nitrospiraceae bacterium]|nr:Fe-Mn family superoxide dismutase [Nitrospiraceae bacterium]